MDISFLIALVKSCRRAQKAYFGVRTMVNLRIARDYERRVDAAIEEYFKDKEKPLFNLEN